MQRILVVDDEEKMLKLLRLMLSEDYDVYVASSVKEAVEIYESNTIDTVISDIKMPREDGFVLLKKLRTIDDAVPIILLTGHGDKQMAIEAVRGGAFDFIEKPFEEEDLRVSVLRAMNFRSVVIQHKFARSVLRRRNIEIKNLTQELCEKDDTKEAEFAGEIIHEIKNPLTIADITIKKIITMVQEGEFDSKELIGSIERVSDMIVRVFETIGNIQTVMEGYSHDEMLVEDMREIFDDVKNLVQIIFDEGGVKLDIIPPKNKISLECQPIPLSQVLTNLLKNAQRFAARQETEQWVRLEAKDLGDQVEISVTDSGKGIPEDVKESMFKPFFTTNEQGKGPGLGLGISKKIVERHHGTIYVDDNCPNTRFVIKLPKKVASGK